MNIQTFESQIQSLLRKERETGLFEDELQLSVAADGCLSASLNGEAIHCEGKSWDQALDAITAFVSRKVAEQPVNT